MSLGRHRRNLDGVMQSLLRAVLSILLGNIRPDMSTEDQIENLVPLLTDEVRLARNRAHQVAAQQLVEEAPPGREVYIPAQRGYPADAVRTVLEENLSGTPAEAANKISAELVRHAEQAGRDTITDAVLDEEWTDEETTVPDDYIPGKSTLKIDFGDLFDEDEDLSEELDRSLQQNPKPVRPIGWARVMTGAETCAFCVMLASRPGAGERRFYTSADAAGGELAKAEYRGTALFVNRYHTNCDCVVVPVYDEDNWSGKDIAEALYRDVYLAALGGKPAEGWRSNKYSENDVVKQLEKWLRTHEYSLPSIREMV